MRLPGDTGEWDVADCTPSSCAGDGVSGVPLGSTSETINNSVNVTQVTYTTVPPTTTPVPPSILLTLAGIACLGFFAARRGWKLA
jgi:hypothetical protein